MRVSTKRILSIGLAGIFIIGAFVVYANFISFSMDTVNEKRGTLAAKESIFATQSDAINQVQNAFAQFENTQDVKRKIELAVPDGVETVSALRQIEAVARRSSVTLTSLEFKEVGSRPSQSPFFKKIGILEVTLSASGSYEGVREFLRLFETNARVINVQEFDFESGFSPERGGGPDQINLKVEMYYQE